VSRRSYGQVCPIARSLDVLGERWTLLVVRELLLGPKRFKDLLAVLPAMGTTRLAERLKALEADGVIAKVILPAPGDVRAYQLTDRGERLRPVVLLLGAWGNDLPLHDGLDPATARRELLALAYAGASDPAVSAGLDEAYDLRVGPETFHVLARDGEVLTRSGPSPRPPAATVTCLPETFDALTRGDLTLPTPSATVTGDLAAATRLFALLHTDRPAPDWA
jgi:DNA-binding HxlR family transcriptional regulator